MKKIPKELLAKIKDAVNLVEVIGEHVVLKKSGSNHSGLCPFHSERSPSFSVSEQKQLYHCFGCNRSGDLVTFIQELHGLSFPEAVEELAERARVALPKDWSDEDGSDDPEVRAKRAAAREKIQLAQKLNRFAAAFFHQSLPKVEHIAKYFRSRGVEGDLAKAFYVGAAPASCCFMGRAICSPCRKKSTAPPCSRAWTDQAFAKSGVRRGVFRSF
jgi:DNA primase